MLCASCAEELKIDPQQGISRVSITDLLSGVLDGAVEQLGEGECSECGQALEELRRNGRAGCPNCYIQFQSVVSTHLKRTGRADQHAGKYPVRLMEFRNFFQRREQLHDALDQAVAAEEYESAAQLRDQLRKLSEEAGSE